MFQKIKVVNQKTELVIDKNIQNIIITGRNGVGKSVFLHALENQWNKNFQNGTNFFLKRNLEEITSLQNNRNSIQFHEKVSEKSNIFSLENLNNMYAQNNRSSFLNSLSYIFDDFDNGAPRILISYQNEKNILFNPVVNLNTLIDVEIKNNYSALNERVSKMFNDLSADLVNGLVQNNGQINEGDMNQKYPFIRLKNAMELFLEGKKIKSVHDQSRKIMIEDVSGEEVEANLSLSDGEKRIFALASLLLENEGKQKFIAYTWDEPENHLSPSWQRKIIPFLNKVSPNTQFILATHSTEILKSMHQRENTIITSLTRDASGIDLKKTNIFDDEQILNEMGWSEKELENILSSQKPILLLEGKTDKKYIKNLEVFESFEVISLKGDGRMKNAIDVLPFFIDNPILGLCDKDVPCSLIDKSFLKTDFLPGLESGEAIEKLFKDTIKSISNDDGTTGLITEDNLKEYEQKILIRATEEFAQTKTLMKILDKQGFVDSNKFKLNNGEHLWSKQKLCDFLTENHKDKVKESLQEVKTYLEDYLKDIENVFPSKSQE